MTVPDDLPSRPAARGARWIVLRLLDLARKTAPRLDNPKDSEALHDFRVSLRRLRTLLRFYRKTLDPKFPRKLIRRIGKIASSTGAGRDAEVQAAFLRQWEAKSPPSRRKAASWLAGRLEARGRQDYAGAAQEAKEDFLELEPRLRDALPPPRTAAQNGPSPASFGRSMGELLLEAFLRLSQDLSAIGSPRDVEGGHRARISGKRLRYLMEPLKERSAAWKRCVSNLKKLQDILGEFHDMHVLEAEVVKSAEELALSGVRRRLAAALREKIAAADEPPGSPPFPGLIQLAKLSRDRQKALFRSLQRQWGEVRRARFFGETAALAASLRAVEVPVPAPKPAAKPRRPAVKARAPRS